MQHFPGLFLLDLNAPTARTYQVLRALVRYSIKQDEKKPGVNIVPPPVSIKPSSGPSANAQPK